MEKKKNVINNKRSALVVSSIYSAPQIENNCLTRENPPWSNIIVLQPCKAGVDRRHYNVVSSRRRMLSETQFSDRRVGTGTSNEPADEHNNERIKTTTERNERYAVRGRRSLLNFGNFRRVSITGSLLSLCVSPTRPACMSAGRVGTRVGGRRGVLQL